MKDYLNKAFAVLFMVLISLPLLTFHHEKGRVSVLENKNAAQWPEISEYSLLDNRLTADFDEYFSDNIGMKDEAVLTDAFIKYRLFDKIVIPQYIKGKEQNLYYIYDETLQTYQGRDLLSDEKMDEVCERITRLGNTIQGMGAKFVFMPIPNKEEIYGEYMPDGIRIVSDESMLHSIKERLIAENRISVVNTEAALLQEKDGPDMVYYRNIDATHWNPYGAFAGYQVMMEAIDQELPRLSWEDIHIEREEISAAFNWLPGLQNIFSDMTDISYSITPLSDWHADFHNDKPEIVSIAGNPQKNYFFLKNETVKNNKKLVVLGDSYVHSFLLPYLGESFSEVYFAGIGNCSSDEVSELLKVVMPDYIVYECVSRTAILSSLEYNLNTIEEALNCL